VIERNFGFLKDPLIANDMFLKKHHRIEALGLIFILALLLWRLMRVIAR
jgi:transposase